jgi:hypothetical protein
MVGFWRHSSTVAFLNVVLKLGDYIPAIRCHDLFIQRFFRCGTCLQDFKLIHVSAVGINLDHVSHGGVACRNFFILLASIDVLF